MGVKEIPNINHEDLVARLQDRLQCIQESELTKNIIIPLFRTLGYDKVDFYHGPHEGGKDVICYRNDPLGFLEVTVIQVKRYKPSASASDKRSFSNVVNQLQQASEKEIPCLDGKSYIPEVIYFITPFLIDARSLESRFEGYTALRMRRIKIIDGSNLSALISEITVNRNFLMIICA